MKTNLLCRLMLVLLLIGLAGCVPSLPTEANPAKPSSTLKEPTAITVLYTSDEHGWMEGQKEGQGAANMVGLWHEKEGYPDKGRFLVLSGGDNWTGPAVSTWYQGSSMLEVMGAMGYQASAVGNHEFDFGLDVLKSRVTASPYPFLAANIDYKKTNAYPDDLGIRAFTIIDLQGVKVGILGLSTKATAYTANPAIVSVFNFEDYTAPLTQAAKDARQAGAQVLILVAHLCEQDLISLASTAQELGIVLMGGGHCHLGFSQMIGLTGLVDSAPFLRGYAYAHLLYNPDSGKTQVKDIGLQPNEGGKADAKVAKLVQDWSQKTNVQAGVVIGYLKNEIFRQSEAMQALIVGAWLWGYPQADVALTNMGGMRDRIPAGEITLGGITSVMPFDNTLVEVHLSGTELQSVLENKLLTPPAIGGLHRSGTQWVLNKTGKPLEHDAIYSVLVNDFMYSGGDHYTELARYDPKAYFTAIDWRQPVIDWIKAQHSSKSQPLDDAILTLEK